MNASSSVVPAIAAGLTLVFVGACVLKLVLYFVEDVEASPPQLAADCTTYDPNSNVFSHDVGCSALERFVDCEADVVCYISQYGMDCLPLVETNLHLARPHPCKSKR